MSEALSLLNDSFELKNSSPRYIVPKRLNPPKSPKNDQKLIRPTPINPSSFLQSSRNANSLKLLDNTIDSPIFTSVRNPVKGKGTDIQSPGFAKSKSLIILSEKQQKNMNDEFRDKLSSFEEKLNSRLEKARNELDESKEDDQHEEPEGTFVLDEYKELYEDFTRLRSWMNSENLNFSLMKKRFWKGIDDGGKASLFKEKLRDLRKTLGSHRDFLKKTQIELTQANLKADEDVLSQEIRDRLDRSRKILDLLEQKSSQSAKTTPRKISSKKNENAETKIDPSNYRLFLPSESQLERLRQRVEGLAKKTRAEPQGRYFFDSEDSDSVGEDHKESEGSLENGDSENKEFEELIKRRKVVEGGNLIETLQRFNQETLKVKIFNKEKKGNPGKFSLDGLGDFLS